MKKLFWLLLILLVIYYCCSCKVGTGTYSEGYQMGLLSKFSEKGFLMKSGEGELYMGNGSSTVVVESGGDDKTKKQINPRLFSTGKDAVASYKPFEGQYVLMHYKEYQFGGFGRDTKYEPIEIKPVNKSLQVQPYQTTNASGNYSQGDRIGRVVKASRKGTLIKSYEVIIQVGGEGSTFLNMSLDDEGLYKVLILYMESATLAKISYKEKFIKNAITEDTPYEIYKIEPYTAPTL